MLKGLLENLLIMFLVLGESCLYKIEFLFS